LQGDAVEFYNEGDRAAAKARGDFMDLRGEGLRILGIAREYLNR
jgi:hypothetical protein